MKKNVSIWLAVVLALLIVLTACGEKSQEKVTEKLTNNLESMDGYKTNAEMRMKTGQEDRNYKIEIWHKKKDFYRVSLANDQDKTGSQIILKNDDGVFVLTPSLNKSFKFQTEWPENSSQPYLYQSLVNDIIRDEEAIFKATDSHYIFLTKTNYQSNNNLPYQEIYIDKKTYTPALVKILDKDNEALIEVVFSDFDLSPSFQKDDFTMDKDLANATSTTLVGGSDVVSDDSLAVVFPLTTVGAELEIKKEIELENGERVIMVFTGEKSFTLIQEKINAVPTFATFQEVAGDIVDLGFAIGAISESKLEWTYGGVDFYLASEDLTKQELIDVAQSVTGKEIK